jgi:hypothetical protein
LPGLVPGIFYAATKKIAGSSPAKVKVWMGNARSLHQRRTGARVLRHVPREPRVFVDLDDCFGFTGFKVVSGDQGF